MLEHLSIYNIYLFYGITYIMCVCLFSALSRRVRALQISIIIIINSLLVWLVCVDKSGGGGGGGGGGGQLIYIQE